MNKKMIIIFLAAVLIFTFAGAAVFAQNAAKPAADKGAKLDECVKNISKVQALLEYFYVQSGIYPESLEQLDRSFNYLGDKSIEVKERIEIPKDPATGKSFVYKPDDSGLSSYRLSPPDAKLYGIEKLELNALSWGWMGSYAKKKRVETGISICKEFLNRVATFVELYANESKGQYPKDLDTLVKMKFVDSPEAIDCPVCKKKYIYKLNKDNTYIIDCPVPAEHKLKQLEYDSLKGVIIK